MTSSAEQGTTLTVTLPTGAPIEPDEADQAHETGEMPAAAAKECVKVLVADDYLNMRRLVISALRKMGYQDVYEAEDGMQALEMLKTKRIGLIISDWNMPKLSGFELLRRVRGSKIYKDTPFLMVTGEAEQDAVVKAMSAGVSGYMIKPFSADMLKQKIDQVLA